MTYNYNGDHTRRSNIERIVTSKIDNEITKLVKNSSLQQ